MFNFRVFVGDIERSFFRLLLLLNLFGSHFKLFTSSVLFVSGLSIHPGLALDLSILSTFQIFTLVYNGPTIQMDTFCPFLSLFTHANVICILFDFRLIVSALSEGAAVFLIGWLRMFQPLTFLKKLIPSQFNFHITTANCLLREEKSVR